MNPMVLTGASSLATNSASIFDSVSRIVCSNNEREVKIAAIKAATDVSCKKIKAKTNSDKLVIEFCYKQSMNALQSAKMTSVQKREFILHSIRTINSVN